MQIYKIDNHLSPTKLEQEVGASANFVGACSLLFGGVIF